MYVYTYMCVYICIYLSIYVYMYLYEHIQIYKCGPVWAYQKSPPLDAPSPMGVRLPFSLHVPVLHLYCFSVGLGANLCLLGHPDGSHNS